MISFSGEKRLLQSAIALGSLVPLGAGLLGVVEGAGMLGHAGDVSLDSHFRYLSGLLLGIALGFLSLIPNIEERSAQSTVLAGIVVMGGLARLFGCLHDGLPSMPMRFGLGMELIIVPLLWLWQRRLARLSGFVQR